MPAQPAFLVVGHVRRPHGTRGELVVESLTDHPGDVFVPGVVLRSADASSDAPDPDAAPLRVDAVRPFQGEWLVCFGGVEDRNAADRLRGLYLLIEREKLPEPGPGEARYWELIGVEVFTADGARVGEIVEVYEQRPADLLEVQTARGKVIVPFVADWVRELDVPGRRLVLDPPEGLLE
jgi:16S rRNA processing protein RimM